MPQTQFIPSPAEDHRKAQVPELRSQMIMTGIEPMGLGTDRRTYECDQCGHEEELLLKL